jgi:small subunit ribosomal protein S4
MARYTGPRGRRARRLFVALTHLSTKDPDKDPSLRRPYPPGQHGPTQKTKMTDYGLRMMEKQKLKLSYELLEKQCRRYVDRAKRSGSNATQVLISLIESRFDALVLRAGFATSIRQARQFVRHGYFTVNGKKANLPGMEFKPGTVVELRERFHAHPLFVEIRQKTAHRGLPPHVAAFEGGKGFRVLSRPEDVDPPVALNLAKIIEFYA